MLANGVRWRRGYLRRTRYHRTGLTPRNTAFVRTVRQFLPNVLLLGLRSGMYKDVFQVLGPFVGDDRVPLEDSEQARITPEEGVGALHKVLQVGQML